MRIYLARHGQNEDNEAGILNGHRDLPLTKTGIKQAGVVSEKIKEAGFKFGVVLASPLSRALETAKIISNDTGNPKPIVEDMLIERDFGVMTGIKQTKIKELCSPNIIETDTITYFLDPEGAETFPDLIDRAQLLLAKVKKEYRMYDSVLLVGHGDVGKMVYAAYYNLPWEKVLRQFHFGNSELLLLSEDSEPENAHIFKIEQFNH